MSHKQDLTRPASPSSWTRPEAYVEAMVRKHSARRSRREPQRSQPEAPRMLLSTVPFIALFAVLAVLTIAIMVVAMPRSGPDRRAPDAPAKSEQGVASKGWFQEAQKEFH